MGMGLAPELHSDVWRGQKNFLMTNFTMPINISAMKFALKYVPGLADVGLGFPMRMGLAAELNPDVLRGQEKILKINFTMPNNISSMKYALKSVLGLADVGVPRMGMGMAP